MAVYEEVLGFLVNIGLLDVILPFLFIYMITYGMLQRSKALGGRRNIDAMVAFCTGFIAIAATQLLNILNIMLAWAVMALVVTIMLALILGLAGAQLEGNKYMIGLAVAVFAIMTLGGLFASGLLTQDQLQSAVLLPLIISGALIGVLIYVLSPGKKSDAGEPEKKKEAAKPKGNDSTEQDKKKVKEAIETLTKAGLLREP